MSFIKFEKMITPIFIQVLFWVGFIGSILTGLAFIAFGFMASSGGFFRIMSGILLMFIGPLAIRIYCEMLIVVFKMQGALTDIRDTLKQSQDTQSTNYNQEEAV